MFKLKEREYYGEKMEVNVGFLLKKVEFGFCSVKVDVFVIFFNKGVIWRKEEKVDINFIKLFFIFKFLICIDRKIDNFFLTV